MSRDKLCLRRILFFWSVKQRYSDWKYALRNPRGVTMPSSHSNVVNVTQLPQLRGDAKYLAPTARRKPG